MRIKNGKSCCAVVEETGSRQNARKNGTNWSQNSIFPIRSRPEVDGTLPDIVEEGSHLTTTREDFDLPELNPDPFGLYTLLTGTNFDGLFRENR